MVAPPLIARAGVGVGPRKPSFTVTVAAPAMFEIVPPVDVAPVRDVLQHAAVQRHRVDAREAAEIKPPPVATLVALAAL